MRTVLAATTCLTLLTGVAHAQVTAPKAVDSVEFKLHPIAAIKSCLSDGDADATVTVRRDRLNDLLKIQVTGLKPNLDFDMFTVQRSPLDENGQPVANFKGFGLAWYQSDLHSDSNGNAQARIRTILIDQIFGVDVDKKDDGSLVLPPTNTFHVGFWFNNPEDAAPCGFDVSKPTPFNGEHKAGPLAMISLPDEHSHLGPLCTDPTGNDPEDSSKLACNP